MARQTLKEWSANVLSTPVVESAAQVRFGVSHEHPLSINLMGTYFDTKKEKNVNLLFEEPKELRELIQGLTEILDQETAMPSDFVHRRADLHFSDKDSDEYEDED